MSSRRLPGDRSPGRTATGRSTLAGLHWLLAALAWVVTLPASASEALVPALERRLSAAGVESVNAYLVGHWSSAMVPFNQQTADCALRAVSLAVQLSRTGNVKSAQAHNDALRIAVGKCTAQVLALAAPPEVQKFCSSSDSWTVMQTVRELRRRIAAIEADPALRSTASGKACREAYLHELHNTRVVLRTAPKDAPR